MTPEEKMKKLLGRVPEGGSAGSSEWNAFAERAHRSMFMKRALSGGAALLLVALLGVGGIVLANSNDDGTPSILPAESPSPGASASGDPTPDPEPSDEEIPVPPEDPVWLQVWYSTQAERLDGKMVERLTLVHQPVEPTQAVARAALEWLLLPTPGPLGEAGINNLVPEGTELLGLTIEDGTASVDLSAEVHETQLGSCCEDLVLGQIVMTLTQFDTVERVRLLVEGEEVSLFGGHGIMIDGPLSPKDFEDRLPPIVVEEPHSGQEVRSGFTLSGTANVFEATVSWRLVDDSGEIASGFTTATCGTGCRGDYSTKVRFDIDEPTSAQLEVFESSAEDGRPLHMVTVHVNLKP